MNASAQPLIVAHRGASHDAPENTQAAFDLAWEQGADAIECDVHLTADGQIVCIHDDTTGRTTGGEKGTGLVVAESTAEELRKLDVGSWKDPAFAGEPVPLLRDVLASLPAGKGILIEVKVGPEIVPALTALLRDTATGGLEGHRVTVMGFDAAMVKDAKAALPAVLPGVTVNWLTRFAPHPKTKLPTLTTDEIIEQLAAINADGLGCKALEYYVNQDFVERLRAEAYGLHVWTVDDPAVGRHFVSLGFDSITTNRPGWLGEQLDLRGPSEIANE
ncbi:MAG: glycerophosphodiester phosphodiesterase [Planctomycetota bacterium]